jgi:prolyl-tRNA synthetase
LRYSKYHVPTLKEDPAEAEVVSHKLLLRAGMIRKLAAGIYNYLPLGLRVIRKVENIIREEMNRAGAMEVLLPAIQPSELWEESGRWQFYGPELLRITDRHGRDFCFGPTHEEVITDLVRRDVRSYRDLPINLYQIQTKFRDEIRPRFGLMRGREFIMKDAYSFDATEEGANAAYQAMDEAYSRIFTRCGLKFKKVQADSGNIGGSFSAEFMVLADSGEDAVVSCDSCEYAANMEKAEVRVAAANGVDVTLVELTKVDTPNRRTVQEVCAFLKCEPSNLVKTLLVEADGKPVAVLLRGDHELNMIKLQRHLKTETLEMAGPELVAKATKAPVGFAGPVGLEIPMIADLTVQGMSNFIVGGNAEGVHLTGVNLGRDFTPTEFADIRNAEAGDGCPVCDGTLEIMRGIEVGHIFKLGTKYSDSMKATFLGEDGKDAPIIMGCYGIGVGRTAASAVEQNHDKFGIIWPIPIAPFTVVITTIAPKGEVLETADALYKEMLAAGIEVIYDDRDERPGVKFKDADLMGIPIRVTVGAKALAEGAVELKLRTAKDFEKVPKEEIIAKVQAIIQEALNAS